jgi:hypothetical protein
VAVTGLFASAPVVVFGVACATEAGPAAGCGLAEPCVGAGEADGEGPCEETLPPVPLDVG